MSMSNDAGESGLVTEPHATQSAIWPPSGRHVLAQFDDTSIWVYQAYRPEIAAYAVRHQRFGAGFSYTRMSWIKPNFLWMMYRAGWATKEGQERILAIRLPRTFFDGLLERAVASGFDPERHASREAWQAAVAASDVRLQWDPDHDPAGRPLSRRAVQLGLRGETLRQYGSEVLTAVRDVTPFVIAQRALLADGGDALVTPRERVYRPPAASAENVGLDPDAPDTRSSG